MNENLRAYDFAQHWQIGLKFQPIKTGFQHGNSVPSFTISRINQVQAFRTPSQIQQSAFS
jgi:hypothetical protein